MKNQNKKQPTQSDKTIQTTFRPLFGIRQVQIRSTERAVTPFGGMASFFAFPERIELPAKLQENMPFVNRSPNSIPPAHTLTAFLCSVVVGASRFAHSDWLRSDKALHAMLGITLFPGTLPDARGGL
jgi:hypothetical protein